jgi:hypothetical protein
MGNKQIFIFETKNVRDTVRKLRFYKIFFAVFAFAVTYLGAAQLTMADDSSCDGVGDKPDGGTYDIRMNEVTYLGPFNSTATDSRADAADSNHTVRLRGWLYYKRETDSDTVKNRPVLIYNHGHDEERNEPCAIVKYFTDKSYVVFAPLRRGHSADNIRSTGLHIDFYTSKCMRSYEQAYFSDLPHLYCSSSYCRPDVPCGSTYKYNATETGYLREQRFDVRDQIAYIKGRNAIGPEGTTGKLADPKRIAVLGHSYGGSLIIFTNKYDYGQSVAISVSGAELSWGSDEPYWELDLVTDMHNQQLPMYFLQPKNGRTLLPTKTLFGVAVSNEYRSQASIFPRAPCQDFLANGDCDETATPEWRQAHSTFIGKTDQVELWGPSVIEFIKRYPR